MAKEGKNDSVKKKKDDSEEEESYKVGSVKKFFNKIAALIKKGAVRIGVVFVAVLIVSLVFLFITFICLNAKYVKEMDGVCVEANEFSSAAKIVRSRPEDDGEIIQLLSTAKYEEYSQKMKPTDLGLTLNGEAILINIAGKWTPWRMDESIFEKPNDSFICLLEKQLLPDGFKFSNRDEENEFYYIKNFYNNLFVKKDEDGDTIVRGIADAPERQKNCWVTRGAGLYLGVYGINGKTQPTAYHHLIASKMICTTANWFGGAVRGLKDGKEDSYVITTYHKPDNNGNAIKLADMDGSLRTLYYNDEGRTYIEPTDDIKFSEYNYTIGDFKRAYFSLDGNYINKIITTDGNQIIYNIEEHERLLYNSDKYKANTARIIASTISMFDKACYSIEKDEHDRDVRKYNAYYQYGPEILYKNHPTFFNIKYDVGEKIKMFIADKYYGDNYGFYQIEILSGINFDDSGTIEGKLKEVEYYFLGTPVPGSDRDRTDGMIAKIYNNLLDSGFASLVRVVLTLYVLLYGYRVIFGFKKDKKLISMSGLMVDLFKLALIVCLVSETGFNLFNKIVMNFVVNGVVGFVDLIAGIFGGGLVSQDNFIALSGGLAHSSDIPSFSKNFKIIDEVLALLKTDTIMLKIFSLFYNTGWNFFLGIPVGLGVLAVIITYIFKLAMVVVPFMFTLLQLTLTLPLAPLFILFNFFEFTKEYFENWLKFVLGKALEIFAFFLGFYFMTFILNNKIKELLNYKVCFYKMGNYIFGTSDDLVFIVKWIRSGLNHALYMEKIGMPDNFFIYYLINIFISLLLLGLFDSITKSIMSIISSIFTIDGATAGDNSTLTDFTGKNNDGSSKFSLGSQFAQFNQTTGLSTIQNESDALKWTKNFVDLEKSGMDNLKQMGENIYRGASVIPNAIIKTADEGIEHKERMKNDPDNEEQLPNFAQRLRDNINQGIADEIVHYTKDAFDENSLIDIHGRNFGKPIGWYVREGGWKYQGNNKVLKFLSKPFEMASGAWYDFNKKHSTNRENMRSRRLDGQNDRYYRKDIFEKNRKKVLKDEIDENLLNLSDEELKNKLNGLDEKATKRIIKLRSLLKSIRSGKIKFNVKGKDLEEMLLEDGTLDKINEYLKDEKEYKGNGTELFSEKATDLLDEDASFLFEEDGSSLINDGNESIIDVRVKKVTGKIKTSVENKDEEAMKAMEEKIKKNKEMEEQFKKEQQEEEEEKKKKNK